MPLLYDGARSFSERIQVSTQPAFYTMSVTLDDHITKVTVMLAPGVTAVDKPVRVYYDGLVVIQGNRPPDPGPDFFDPEGQAGTWDGKPFTNLVRNGSFEKGWFGVRARVEQFIQTNYTVYSPAILASVYDWPGAGWYYQSAAKQLLQTFWGKFGWGHIPLAWKHSYRVLGLLTLAGLLGSLISLARRWQKVDKEILFFLIAALFVVWGVTFYRGIGSIDEATFIPSARYAFPVAILTMLAFTAGWLELLRLLSGGKTAWEKLQVALIGLFFAGLDILSVWSIVKFYG